MDNLQNVFHGNGKYPVDRIHPFETCSNFDSMDQGYHKCDSEEPIAQKFSKRWYYLVIALLYLGELQ